MPWSSSTTIKKLGTRVQLGKMVSQRSCTITKPLMPRTSSLPGLNSPIQEQMVALQQKIQLIEYDHKAYRESIGHTIKENQEIIKLLQQQNKNLSQEIFLKKQRQADRVAKYGPVIAQFKEDKLHDNIRLHNALCHQAQVRMNCLEELELRLKQNATVRKHSKTNQDKQIQQLLENRLEEARIKLQEVEHINSVYMKIVAHLQEEIPTFLPQIQELQTEILLFRNELKDLKIMNQNAVMSRYTAMAEHKHLKEEFRCQRRNKVRILRDLSHQASELRRYEKKLAMSRIFSEDKVPVKAHKISLPKDEEKRIHTYVEALQKIKKATGGFTKSEVLQRFIHQGETREYLEKEKLKAEKTLSELKDKQDKMDKAVQELKYSGQVKLQAKLSNNQKTLEELRTQLQLETKNRDKSEMEAKKTLKVLNKATCEVTRIALRLKYAKVPGTSLSAKDLPLNLHVLDLFSIIGQKLQNLQKQLEGRDVEKILREMKYEAFLATIKHSLQGSSSRISLPSPSKQDTSDSEEDHHVTTRKKIKETSQKIILANRRPSIWCEKWLT